LTLDLDAANPFGLTDGRPQLVITFNLGSECYDDERWGGGTEWGPSQAAARPPRNLVIGRFPSWVDQSNP
jgi:hypothetical protein